jgi:hypothetical protein
VISAWSPFGKYVIHRNDARERDSPASVRTSLEKAQIDLN